MPLYQGINIPGRPDPENVRRLDLLPIPMIRRMQRYGIAIDVPYFQQLTSDLTMQMNNLRLEVACEIPPERLDKFCALADEDTSEDDWSPINVDSSQQLGKLIFDILGIGKSKQLKRTAGGELSTGKKQLELLKQEHPIIGLVLSYRERAKLVNTYTGKLPNIARSHPKGYCTVCEFTHKYATKRVHTEFTTTRTDTGRLASKSPNLQNIPARTKLGRAVRAGFIASPGTRLLSRDFSQIELRLLAHCAIEHELINIFLQNLDPHLMTAMRAFGITDPSKVDKLLHRAPCKNVNFGVVYGLSAPGLYDLMALTYATAGLTIPLSMDINGVSYQMVEQSGTGFKYPWAQEFINQWFALYPEVSAYMEQQYYRARRYGVVWDIFGRTREVPEVQSCLRWIQGAGLRQSGNMPIQSSGAGLMKLAMGETEDELLRIWDGGKGVWCWPELSIHDEMIIEVDEDYCEGLGNIVGNIMDNVMVDKGTGENMCRVPILSDGHPMERWVKD